jgi:hypothetical protein
LIVVALGAVIFGAPLRESTFRRKFSLLLATYAIPVVIIGVGAILRYDGPPAPGWAEPPAWRGAVLWAVVIAHVAAVVAAAILMRGARIRAVAVGLPGIWLSLSSGFVAAVAIGGVGP